MRIKCKLTNSVNFMHYLEVTLLTMTPFHKHAIDLGAAYMRKIIPPGWDVSPEQDLCRMVYFTF